MLCRLTDVCHAPSEPPAKRTLDRTEIDVKACEVRPRPAVHDCHRDGVQTSSLLSIISYEKASQVFKEKELDKRSAVKSCQACSKL